MIQRRTKHGSCLRSILVHAGDKWYHLAGREVPEEERYDGYLQLDNGVGMLRLLIEEFQEYLETLDGDDRKLEVSIATGALAFDYLAELIERLRRKFPNVKVHLYQIINQFFGERITVSGLITGQDLLEQLKGKELGTRLLLPCNMFRSGEEVFLDDITLSQVKETLQVEADIVKSSGRDFIEAMINGDK